MTATTIVFDVNETLLDLGALRPHFEQIFGDAHVTLEWFAQVLLTAMTLTTTGAYHDFGAVGQASLSIVGARHGVAIDDETRTAVGSAMLDLPAHADSAEGLEMLATSGYRLVALTNSPQESATRQLTNAGLAGFFDRIMSVEAVARFKPSAEVYELAARELNAAPADMWMVAAHPWDLAGAAAVGLRGALVTRPGVVAHPLYPAPAVTGNDIIEVAKAIIANGAGTSAV